MNNLSEVHMPRILCVFAHPDDETFCAGGTFAKYIACGAEVMVVSATRGEAGQIRSPHVAMRHTLGAVREQVLPKRASDLVYSGSCVWIIRTGHSRTLTEKS